MESVRRLSPPPAAMPRGSVMTLEEVLQSLPPLPPRPMPATLPPPAEPAVFFSSSASSARRRPLIVKEEPEPGARCAEMAGGTAAGCAAVVCCCPCGIANLLVSATVRLPAGLCRRALLRKRMKKKRAGRLLQSRPLSVDAEDFGVPRIVPLMPESWPTKSPAAVVSEKEKEMWGQFYSAGFWRSPSQRE